MNRLHLMAILPVIAALAVLVPCDAQSQDDKADELLVAEVWSEVKSAIPNPLPEREADPDAFDAEWMKSVLSINKSFGRITTHPNRKELLGDFVSRFGKEGPYADFAWFIALGPAAAPYSGPGLYGDEDPASRRNRTIQLEVAEAQVRLFLHNRELLKRYTEFLYWGGFIDTDYKYIVHRRNALNNIGGPEYWWRSRDLLALIVGSGHDELLNGVEPDQLANVAQRWKQLQITHRFAVPPNLPFPDWKGTLPVSGRWLREFD